MTNDFSNLLARMTEANVDFVVVGGFAGIIYGCTYVTQDIDICCDFSPENLLRLQKALSQLHPVHRMTPDRQKLELTGENCSRFKNLYLDTDIGQLDCLSFIDGVGDFQSVKKASILVEANDLKLQVLSLDALIETKKAMNRPRDNEILLQLEAIKKQQTKTP